ncbi:transposase [Phaeobacter sp. C3_T13_0]|uniref:transposase n=1 Tax=Phaeobacter cretensis TaxID=3342641 RepID=UPI0039BC3CF7
MGLPQRKFVCPDTVEKSVELMIRMVLLGYCMGIGSERGLCEEVHVTLAYRWFCRLDLLDAVPDHSGFSKNRHGCFRESGLFRHLFEIVLQRGIDEGRVGGHSFGLNASLIPANANQTRGIESKEGLPPELTARVIDDYLETRDDAAFGAATKIVPKYISPVDPAARRTASIWNLTHCSATGGYGSAEMLGWLIAERGIAPHIPVWDKSKRTDGTFSREDPKAHMNSSNPPQGSFEPFVMKDQFSLRNN